MMTNRTNHWNFMGTKKNRIQVRVHDLMTNEDMGLSENVGYIPNYSHLIGIMIIDHWV